ncbi:MAG: exopolysaccharide biosynthesis protein [Syntrophomonadaceae bacterium]|nr:exopolysaccharide biosynthesis protein [Syntrophomonadaceae bacterium]
MNYPNESKPPSELIREALGNKEKTLTVEDIITAFGSQSFGLVFIIMALPLVIPLPPGVGFIPAGLLCVWAIQRSWGGTFLWLPRKIARHKLSAKFINNIETKAIPFCERLEEKFFSSGPTRRLSEMEIRIASMMVAALSILIMLPTPGLNSIFAALIILLGITVLNSNRKLLWINMSFGLMTVFLIGSTLYAGSELLFNEIDTWDDFF